jgi:uncharacterized membrane protein
MEILTTIVAAVYVLFIPGFTLSYVFFRKDTIDLLERIALSLALSIAVVPLITFYLNLVGVKISRTSVALEIALVILISLVIIGYKKFIRGIHAR